VIYDISGKKLTSNSKPNTKIIAHRGYHAVAAQNTIAAFVAAADAGFDWIEIDIRKCADGIYVMSHDATVTLYNNGEPVSVNVPNSNYSSIKDYTWDSEGQYKICTLQAVFNAMMIYDMNLICDLKNGSNADVMNLAALSGAVDKVLLSYGSFQAAYNDRDLLLKYDNVPIRCIPTNYTQFATLASAIGNPIYADVNASDGTHYQQYLNIALSCGIPIIFSGCTTANYKIWSVLANGCMANLNLNIKYDEFFELLDNNYDGVSTITPSVSSISVSINGESSVTGESDSDTAGGYVYCYSKNPSVASAKQTAFGKNAAVTVTGKAAGTTDIIMFDGYGEMVVVPVTVTAE
jgi:hypothetical protein